MSNAFHKSLKGADLHSVHAFTDTKQNLDGLSLNAEDVGKVALATDLNTFWILGSHDPVSWLELTVQDTDTDTDELVKLSPTGAASYLEDLIASGDNITITEVGGKLVFSAADAPADTGSHVVWYQAVKEGQAGFSRLNGHDLPIDRKAHYTKDPDTDGFYIYAFDDDNDEGVQFTSNVPPTVTQVRFVIKHHARNQANGDGVCVQFHAKGITVDQDLDGDWTTAPPTFFSSGGGDDLRCNEKVYLLTDLGLNPGDWVQFELSRNASHGPDNLDGDWILMAIGVEYL